MHDESSCNGVHVENASWNKATVHCILRPAPIVRKTRLVVMSVFSYRTGQPVLSSRGVSLCTTCSDAATVASCRHRASIQNHDVIHKTGSTLHIATPQHDDRPGHGHRQKAWTVGKVWRCGSSDMRACGETNKQKTNRQSNKVIQTLVATLCSPIGTEQKLIQMTDTVSSRCTLRLIRVIS